MTSNNNAEPLFDTDSAIGVRLGSTIVRGLANALDAFRERGVELQNYDIYISQDHLPHDETGLGVATIDFLAKLFPGKKGLGNANRMGESITYLISNDGTIVREYGIK